MPLTCKETPDPMSFDYTARCGYYTHRLETGLDAGLDGVRRDR